MQVGGSADPVDLAALGQLVRDRHGVRGFAPAVEVDDGLVDGLVGGPVEVLAAEDLHDVGDGVLGEHHAAQHGLLGQDVLRRLAAEFGVPTCCRIRVR